MTTKIPCREGTDWVIALLVIGLLVLGIFITYSASAIYAQETRHDPYYFLRRQVGFAAFGLLIMIALASSDLAWLRKWSPWIAALSLALLLLVLIPGIGYKLNGARRWIKFGPLLLQPSELAKIALIAYSSRILVRREERQEPPKKALLPIGAVTGIAALLTFLEPDLGSAAFLVLLAMCLLYIGGAPWRYLLLPASFAPPALVVAILIAPYRVSRILAYVNPWSDPLGSGFQCIQSLLAFGNGGLLGQGFGVGRQKLFYLSQAHTDFLFAIAGEELGFVGSTGIVLLFALLIWRGARAAARAESPFLRQVAAGLTCAIGLQALIHMGVVTKLLPPKGMGLPFMSYGGSSLLVTMIAAGMLLSISRQGECR